MRMAKVGAVAVSLVFAGVLVAQNNDYAPDPSWKAPAREASNQNPFARDASAANKGRELYNDQCSMCHGPDGRGLANAANFHEPAVQRQSDGTLFWKITTGNTKKGMPSFKQTPENDRWQLVSYIRTFSVKSKSALK
jgi:mono/diheme cytochrome c family protein